ncbi:MAG: nucleotidyl transferase AbiEii/AbiGii toxin family protein [Verrucomicrobiia bacterium]
MKLTSFEAIVRALNAAEARYLVAGGLAVNAHGYARFTNDVDLVIRPTETDILAAFKALEKIGYRPVVPVTAREFADPINRRRLAKTKKMTVLQMWSDKHRETPVDIFVTEPFDFDVEYKTALIEPLSPKVPVRFVSIKALIKLKTKAGRMEDKVDIKNLKAILKLKPAKR